MDNDRAEDLGTEVVGSVKEAIGKVTGDTRLEAEGTAQKASGTAPDALGGSTNTVRDTVKK